MNSDLVDRIVDAVLYEGYMLYPYRRSVKNRQRWTFGGLYPDDYTRAHQTGDASFMQAECLTLGDGKSTIAVQARFLHLIERTIQKLDGSLKADSTHPDAHPSHEVESLDIGDRQYIPWQEATERKVELSPRSLDELLRGPIMEEACFPRRRNSEPIHNHNGDIVGRIVREQENLRVGVELGAAHVSESLFRLTVRVLNLTSLPGAATVTRDQAQTRSLISSHAVLSIHGGQFLSQTSPPDSYRQAADACRNIGVWPVFVGSEGDTDTMLCSPIILYDYPQVAPESPSDLFDATEIDEILTLRIRALSDNEKKEVAAIDERVGALLRRTEALTNDELSSLHGAMRGLRPTSPTPTRGAP